MAFDTSSRNYLYIDATDAQRKIQQLSLQLSERELQTLAYRVVKRTGSRVKGIVSSDVPKKYHIKKNVVAADIGGPRMGGSAGAGEAMCTIPIDGKRHIIGGKTFTARGGRKGWNGIKGGKRYKITTQIIKGKTSVLPGEMEKLGGNPPFRNLSAAKLNNAVFTRRRSGPGFPPGNFPLARVVGPAVPQMPMNRAQDDVQEDIASFMMQRIEHEYKQMIGKIR